MSYFEILIHQNLFSSFRDVRMYSALHYPMACTTGIVLPY